MIRENRIKIIISSLLTLLPVLFGVIVWNKLPEKMAIHFNLLGEADGFGARAVVVFVLPLVLFMVNLLCFFATVYDNKKREQSKKVLNMVLWIVPVISIYVSSIMYAISFGMDFNLITLTCILFGFLFIVIGNYMPKCKRNYTIGIKIRWTLANEENWNKTHRFAGKVWFIGGFAMLLAAFLPQNAFVFVLIGFISVIVLLPIIYSYIYYKKMIKDGSAAEAGYDFKNTEYSKKTVIISSVALVLILTLCAIICFTGNIEVDYSEQSFTLEASYYRDITVKYSDIEEIEYRDNYDFGVRIFGFGTPRLLMGTFENDEFGKYTLYAYAKSDSAVILTIDGKKLAISGKDTEETKDIYEELLLKTEG